MRETAWSEYREPLEVKGPGEGFVYFGPDPVWTPRRENQKEVGCRECGGVVVHRLDSDELPIAIPLDLSDPNLVLVTPEDDPINRDRKVCAACLRWCFDRKLSVLMAEEFARRGSNDPIPADEG